jgi:hypothetical protein
VQLKGVSDAGTKIRNGVANQSHALFLRVPLFWIWGRIRDFPRCIVFTVAVYGNFTRIALLPKDH